MSGIGNGAILINVDLCAEGQSSGTILNNYTIGNHVTGAKTLTFDNGFLGVLSWTPTGAQTITLPDATGTVALTSGLHSAVTLGTANGLSLTGQELSLPTTAAPTFAKLIVPVGSGGNLVSLGTTAKSWHASSVDLQLGLGGAVVSGLNVPSLIFLTNAYESSVDGNWKYINASYANQFIMYAGMFWYQDAASGVADTNIAFRIRFACANNGDAGLGGTISDASTMAGAVIAIKGGKVGIGGITSPNENLEVADTIRANTAFNLNGTDGVTQASAAGKVSDVTALAGGIATAQTQVTPIADNTYTIASYTTFTTVNGRITALA